MDYSAEEDLHQFQQELREQGAVLHEGRLGNHYLIEINCLTSNGRRHYVRRLISFAELAESRLSPPTVLLAHFKVAWDEIRMMERANADLPS